MSYNKKLLKQMTEESKQKKPQLKPKDRIVDPMGQWAHPGEVTRIPSNRITMQGVPYPVLGIGDSGQQQMMFPGQQYSFPGSNYVDEFPLVKAQNGLNKKIKKEKWGDYEIVNSKDENQRYPVYKGDVEQIIATAIGMGYDPKTAMAVALQETGAGKSDPNYFHVLHNDSLPKEYQYMPDDELGIQMLKDKKAYANRLGYKTPVMELQAYNGLGKIFPDTEKDYHGFRMSRAYGVPIPEEGIDMKKNPLYGKRVLSIKDDVVEHDPFINEKINYYKDFYNNPDSTYYTRGSQLGNIEIVAPKKKNVTPDFSNWLHKRMNGGDISIPDLEENNQPRVYKRGGQASLNKFYKELFENINKRTGKGNARFLGRALGSLETVIENPLNALQVLFAKKKRIADVQSNPYGIDPFSMQKGHWNKTWFPKYYVDDAFGGGSSSNQVAGDISSNNLTEQSVNQKRSTPHMYGWFDPSIEGGKQGGWHRKQFPTYEDAYNFWKTQHEGKAIGPNVRFDPIREGDDLTEYGDGGPLPRFQGTQGSSQVGKTYTPQQVNAISGYIRNLQNQPKVKGRAVNKPMATKPIVLQAGYTQNLDPTLNKRIENEAREKAEEERQIQERKNAATTREKVIGGDETAEFTFPNGQTLPWNKMDWRQQAYVSGKNLGNLQRNDWTDFISPSAIIGSLGEGLATAPYVARETDSYMPYVTGIGAPLLMGRMSSTNTINPTSKTFWTGQNTTRQFLNNNFNPIFTAAETLDRFLPSKVDDSFVRSSIIPTSRKKVKPSVKATNDKSGQLAGWGDDSYSGAQIIPHTTASGNKYNIDFRNVENVPRGYEWQRNFDISNAESQGQHFGFKISKRKNNIPILEDLSFFNSDPVTANEQLKLFLAGIDNTPIHIPLSERQFGLSSGSQNLSMYSQPIMNIQAARLARQLGSDGKRRLELIYDNTRPLKELNLSYKQGADQSSFRDQLIDQWEKINKSYKMLADETGVKMKRPRLYYEKFNSFDMPREVGIDFFQNSRFAGRNALMPVETKLHVPEYGLIKHFGDGGILPRFQGNQFSQVPDYLKRRNPVGDIAQQTGIKSNEQIMAEIQGAARLKQKQEQAARTRTTIGPDTRTSGEKQRGRELYESKKKYEEEVLGKDFNTPIEIQEKNRRRAEHILHLVDVGTMGAGLATGLLKGTLKGAPKLSQPRSIFFNKKLSNINDYPHLSNLQRYPEVTSKNIGKLSDDYIKELKEYAETPIFRKRVEKSFPNMPFEEYKRRYLQQLEIKPEMYTHGKHGLYESNVAGFFRKSDNLEISPDMTVIYPTSPSSTLYEEISHQSKRGDELLPNWLKNQTEKNIRRDALIDDVDYMSLPEEFDAKLQVLRRDLKDLGVHDYTKGTLSEDKFDDFFNFQKKNRRFLSEQARELFNAYRPEFIYKGLKYLPAITGTAAGTSLGLNAIINSGNSQQQQKLGGQTNWLDKYN